MCRYLFLVLVGLGLFVVTGCGQLGYYSQSVSGHMSIMSNSRPIDEILEDPETSEYLKQRLTRAREFRRFASDVLLLPENDSYLSYADTGRSAAVWNVVAAPDDSLTPKQWCFLFAGCLPYRGYYDRAEANEFAAGLRAERFDVLTYGVPAYSTLGWFDDPLLNTLIGLPDWALAGVMFHELAHQLIYVEDDTIFNEAFAQSMEEEGRRRWMEMYGSDADRESFQQAMARQDDFQKMMNQTRGELLVCYAPEREREARLACKGVVLEQMARDYATLKRSWGNFTGYDSWFKQGPNNAHFVSSHTYRHYVPAFERILREQAGDLPKFYAEVRRLSELSKPERHAFMERLLNAIK